MTILDEVYRLINTGEATRASELVDRIISIGMHLPAHEKHLEDVRNKRRIAGRVPSKRCAQETAMMIVDRALQELRKAGQIELAGYGPKRGWKATSFAGIDRQTDGGKTREMLLNHGKIDLEKAMQRCIDQES